MDVVSLIGLVLVVLVLAVAGFLVGWHVEKNGGTGGATLIALGKHVTEKALPRRPLRCMIRP